MNKKPFTWDHFLKPEVIKYYEDKGEQNPREREILTNIMNEKKPENLPFKMTSKEKTFYQKALKEYEEMKKANPGEEVSFVFINGI